MTTTTRRAIHAYLSNDAHEAWHDFAAQHGVSVSGLLEAYGQSIESLPKAQVEALVKETRKIDATRRRRRGRKAKKK